MTLLCSNGHFNSTDSRFCRICGQPLPVQPPSGQLLGWRYRVVSELGHGGFGRTYLAEDTNRFNEQCVLKELAPQVDSDRALQKAEELFAREAGILYKLQHPQIPSFREMFRAEWQGREGLFLVQDYVEGETYYDLLQARLQRGMAFSEAEVVQVMQQLLPVLDYIHSAGVIHRDISPDNLIQRSPDCLPVLIDFGGVKQVAAQMFSDDDGPLLVRPPKTVTRLGKVGYAPAEQLEQGEVYPHSDLYALAVTVLVLATGKEPSELFNGSSSLDRRHWHRHLALKPALKSILDQMLDPYPAKRYQSAQAVMQALAAAGYELSESPLPVRSAGVPVPVLTAETATIAVAPKAVSPPATHARPQPKPMRQPQPGRGRAIATVLLLTSMIAGGWWMGVAWLGPALKEKLPDIVKPSGKKNSPSEKQPPVPLFSKTEQERKQQIEAERSKLGVDHSFLVKLVNEAFYARHPELNGRKLATDEADAALRRDWDEIALQTLERLAQLSTAARSRLGTYTETNVRDRQSAANRINLSSRALNDLTDASFFQLFPDQPRNQTLLDRTIGQVWQGLADDQLNALQAGKTLEQIEFPAGNFSDRRDGKLKPGEGKAYIANLGVNQTLQLQLQAPNQSVSLSLYPPTSKASALLEDSHTTRWSGKVTEPGFYEITVVSNADAPVDYTLDLAIAEDISALPTTSQP